MRTRYQSETKTPLLSEVVFSVAVNRNTVMFMHHLATALFVDQRLLEANYFTDRWLALEPDSFDAINLKAIICVERGELRTAADSYNKMGLCGLPRSRSPDCG